MFLEVGFSARDIQRWEGENSCGVELDFKGKG